MASDCEDRSFPGNTDISESPGKVESPALAQSHVSHAAFWFTGVSYAPDSLRNPAPVH